MGKSRKIEKVLIANRGEIAIRVAPDGTVILPLRVIKPSGNPAWDSAVLRGIEKTETFPRDNDGKFPAPFTLAWHLKE